MRATRFCCSAASLSRFLNVCSMLWTVPTGFAAFRFAEYVARPRTKRSGMRSSSWSSPNPPLFPLLSISKPRKAAARLHRLIVTPGEDRERQSLGRFLPRAFAGENAIAHCHAELVGIVCISGGDVGFDIGQVLFRFRDLPRQVANLPADMALLIGVNGAQLIELSDFRIDLDLFNDGRIAGCNRLDLRVGERAALQILRRAHRGFSPHHLLDEAGLGFERLPHVGVEGPFGDVAEDLNLFVRVSLAQDPAFPLLDIARSPGRIQVMKRDEPPLNIRAGAHLLGRSEQYPNSPGVHRIEEQLLGCVRLGVMDERDLARREHPP